MRRGVKGAFAIILVVVICAAVIVVAILLYQGKRQPTGDPSYVALGSSFAAGVGLGARASGSPFACMRTDGGYPTLLARSTGLSLVDMTCSGATAEQVLSGGQLFQGPQIAPITRRTRLVTLTVGGNDLFYVGDLLGLAKSRAGGIGGWAAEWLLSAPHRDSERDAGRLRARLREIVRSIRKTAPDARIAIVSYPSILPDAGTCAALGLTSKEAALMRPAAAMLASATRIAARETNALLIDIAAVGGHDACSPDPWVNGAAPGSNAGTAFHPNRRGAAAVAAAIEVGLSGSMWPTPSDLHEPTYRSGH